MNQQSIGRNAVWSGIALTALTITLTGCAATDAGGASPGERPAKEDGITLFTGRDLSGWEPLHADRLGNTWQAAGVVQLDVGDPTKLFIEPGEGILVNGPAGRTCDIYTAQTFGDCTAHVEFMVPQGSNSGVYFMGEYEIQVFDSYGKAEVEFSDCGGIYARWVNDQNVEGHAPKLNASKPPGEWQTFDVVFRAPRFDADGNKTANARFMKVTHNGKLIHENVELNGPTRAGMTGQEKPTGPIMLQGDHGPVAFRNLRIKP